jgi:hypothetical protein
MVAVSCQWDLDELRLASASCPTICGREGVIICKIGRMKIDKSALGE